MSLRKLTKEGRINIPKDILNKFNIHENDLLEVSTTKDSIIITKYQDLYTCSITGEVSKNLIKIGNAHISQNGFEKLKEVFNTSEFT